MRKITTHKLPGLNDHLDILCMDEKGPGGANHEYQIHLMADPAPESPKITADSWQQNISFQKGPIKEAGVNGISGEALVAIVIDRLESFQAGPFPCEENAEALRCMQEGLMWLQKRTKDRLARGVEGTTAA